MTPDLSENIEPDNIIIVHEEDKREIFKRIDDFIAYFTSGNTRCYRKHKFHRIKPHKTKPQFYFSSVIKRKIGDYFVIKLDCMYFNTDKETVSEKLKQFADYVRTGRLVV